MHSYGGAQDLENKIIRHVSDAFKDDPFRVYRVMRFKARFPNFNIAPETIDLMKEIINTSSFKSISPDRIIKELRVVLSLPKPSLFFEGLKDLKALYCFFPELEKLINVPQSLKYHPEGDAWTHTMLVLDQAASLTDNILVRYSCLVHDLGKGITPIEELPRHIDHEKTGIKLVEELSQRILAPNDWVEAAIVVTKFHLKIHRILEMKASSIIRMFYEMDAFRKPHLIHILSVACQADEMGKLKTFSPESTYLENYFNLVKDVSINDINEGMIGKDIGEAIRQKRINLLKKFKIDNGHQD